MTTLMVPPSDHRFPGSLCSPPHRTGILINASPSNSEPSSPKRLSSCLLPSPSLQPHTGAPNVVFSNSSASSSTSSTDDISSSASLTSSTAAHSAPSPSQFPSSASSRRIRFAPLPEPRRDEFDDETGFTGFFPDIESVQSSPSAPTAPVIHPAPPGLIPAAMSQFSSVMASASHTSSTLGLTLDGVDLAKAPSADSSTQASNCGTDDTLTPGRRKGSSWARFLRLGYGSSKNSRSSDELGLFNLGRCSSRESTLSMGSLRGGSQSDTSARTTTFGWPLGRRQSTGMWSFSPSSSPTSTCGGMSFKPVISEAGASAPATKKPAAAQRKAPPMLARRGTRLLNGRVYGSRAAARLKENPFATARDDEPEFVEWGYGGMGSVRSASALRSSTYAALQSDKKLSIGHVADGTTTGQADDDDGGGMSWLRKRKEKRERELKESMENETKEKLEAQAQSDCKPEEENVEAKEMKKMEETEPTEETEDGRKIVQSTPVSSARSASPAEQTPESTPDHIYTAVTIPALKPKPHQHYRSLSSTQSTLSTVVSSGLATPTNHAPLDASAVVGVFETDVSPSASAPTPSDDEDDGDDEGQRRDNREDESEDEEILDADELARKTAMSAGVEKVSRHKA